MNNFRKYGLVLALLVAAGIVVVIVAQAQQPRQFFGKRGRGAPDAPVPVLAAQAKLADVPVYLDGVGTTKALNTVEIDRHIGEPGLRGHHPDRPPPPPPLPPPARPPPPPPPPPP